LWCSRVIISAHLWKGIHVRASIYATVLMFRKIEIKIRNVF
jgi:hypothetical protein